MNGPFLISTVQVRPFASQEAGSSASGVCRQPKKEKEAGQSIHVEQEEGGGVWRTGQRKGLQGDF